ncbi:hypothetical protein AB0M89_37060 [Streptomyces microflavus]|uniref:hypothetical protein n=1 Tax=Streptomyces microflavus TaxID=1919 RepID=UPI0034348F7E
MNALANGQEDFSYLTPLFKAAAAYREDDHFLSLPEVAEHSSLAKDDEPLGARGAAKFVRSSFEAGLIHVEAFAQLVTVAQHVDPHSPWTLLRGALEDFATAAWLLAGQNREERRHRVLRLWAEDFRNRDQYERDTNHVPGPGGKSGAERREEVKHLAQTLGLPKLTKPEATRIIYEAAASAGLAPTPTQALWRVASGFAHGRFWPDLRASKIRNGIPLPDGGALVHIVVDDIRLEEMAETCRKLLEHTASQYTAASSAS